MKMYIYITSAYFTGNLNPLSHMSALINAPKKCVLGLTEVPHTHSLKKHHFNNDGASLMHSGFIDFPN
jgi:hypothetical protein